MPNTPDKSTNIYKKQIATQRKRWKVITGRTKFHFTPEVYRQIEECAAIGCSIEELCVIIGCSRAILMAQKAQEIERVGTHNSRLCDALHAGEMRLKSDIRRALKDKIRSGSMEAIKFACKVLLGLEETQKAVLEVSGLTKLSDKELLEQVKPLLVSQPSLDALRQ